MMIQLCVLCAWSVFGGIFWTCGVCVFTVLVWEPLAQHILDPWGGVSVCVCVCVCTLCWSGSHWRTHTHTHTHTQTHTHTTGPEYAVPVAPRPAQRTHTTSRICCQTLTTHIISTIEPSFVISIKHRLSLPDDGSYVIRNMLE